MGARFFVAAALAVSVVVLFTSGVLAQDDSPEAGPLRPDLPLEREATETPLDDEDDHDGDGSDTGGTQPKPTDPPTEQRPTDPSAEFFDEVIEAAEVIFVIDRTGSMRWPSKLSIVGEDGEPVNNARKYHVARIELIKAIGELAENMKFAIVCFSTGGCTSSSLDSHWSYGGGGHIQGTWSAWPPAGGMPAPLGYHRTDRSNLPVWPSSKTLIEATEVNKKAAVAWTTQRLSDWEVTGGTCTYDGMSAALKMVTPPPPGKGPHGEARKSATAVYLLTDGAPTHILTVAYGLCRVYGSYDAGEVANDSTYSDDCMGLTKSKVLAENIHNARIYTLGMGMNMAAPNGYVWNQAKNGWDCFPTEFNDKCRRFLTELAEATGGHYREISR
jgi:hypothetical protein